MSAKGLGVVGRPPADKSGAGRKKAAPVKANTPPGDGSDKQVEKAPAIRTVEIVVKHSNHVPVPPLQQEVRATTGGCSHQQAFFETAEDYLNFNERMASAQLAQDNAAHQRNMEMTRVNYEYHSRLTNMQGTPQEHIEAPPQCAPGGKMRSFPACMKILKTFLADYQATTVGLLPNDLYCATINSLQLTDGDVAAGCGQSSLHLKINYVIDSYGIADV